MAACKDCKDCFHYELCGAFGYISPVECGFYTDRSRFVDLPFGVGDTYFEIICCFDDSKPCIIEFHIDKIVKLKNAYGELVDVFYEDKKAGRFSNALKPDGRRFYTREEAKRALEEIHE